MRTQLDTLDWGATPLGPRERWSASLRGSVSLLLGSRFPMALWWGAERIQICNDAFASALGAPDHAALGRRANEVWPALWESLSSAVDHVSTRREPVQFADVLALLERGERLEETYWTSSISPVDDDDGSLGGLLLVCHDTTARVVRERESHTLRALSCRAAGAASSIAIYEATCSVLSENPRDLPFTLLYIVDRNVARLVGHTGFGSANAPLLGATLVTGSASSPPWPITDVMHQRASILVESLGARLSEVPAGAWSEPPRCAWCMPLGSGQQGRCEGVLVAGLSPHRAFDDGYRSFLTTIAEHTAAVLCSQRARAQERERIEMLADLNQAKSNLFSRVSAEFRNPLTLALGPIEMAAQNPDEGLRGQALENVRCNHQRLMSLVERIFELAGLEQEAAQARFARVDLGALTCRIASKFQPVITRAGLELECECPTIDDAYVDTRLWECIVLDLISNAFRFTLSGSIAVGLERRGEVVDLIVADTGVGIPRTELPRVFERFYRVGSGAARARPGPGLGLTVVHELAAAHKATVSVSSELGRGTRVTVSLPLGRDHLSDDQILPKRRRDRPRSRPPAQVREAESWVRESILWSGDGEQPFPRASSSAARILVVNRDQEMCSYLASLLRTRWSVRLAHSAHEARDALGQSAFDLVVADVSSSRDLDLIDHIKSNPKSVDTSALVITTRSEMGLALDSINAGADDFIEAPFSPRELVARTTLHVKLARSRRERTRLLSLARKAQREAARQKEHLTALFSQAPAPIVMMRGPDHRVEFCNPQFHRVFGHGRGNLIGKPLLQELPQLAEQGFGDILDGVMSSSRPYVGRALPIDAPSHSRDGLERHYFNVAFTPLFDEGGESTIGVMGIAYDVSEEVSSRAALEALRGEAESANRAKDEFLAMLGHELRNPLSPIVTALKLMRIRGLSSREQDIIERQVAQIARLVDDLLDISRITRGRLELRKEHVELSVSVLRAIEMSSPLLERHRHRLTMRVPRRGLMVHVDPGRMAQVVSNLLSNAAKYSEPESTITIEAERTSTGVRVAVRDQGIGIDPVLMGNVFDRFVQGEQSLARSLGGLGLGLTVVRSIVELHGGTVSVTSEGVPGRGSEFVIELPAEEAPDSAAGVDVVAYPRRRRTSSAAGTRILVVDDNRDAAVTLREALQALGYEVADAEDGPSALALALTFQPDIALLDIGLPVMDGYELAARMLEMASKDIRLVALTGYGQETDRNRSAAVGFHRHLVKPVNIDALESLLRDLVEHE